MNAATTMVAAWTSVPEKITRSRCQITWYSRAAKPDAKNIASAAANISRQAYPVWLDPSFRP